MPMLHDPAVRSSIEARLNSIRSDSPRQWGSMTVDQMLWHVNQFLAGAMGEGPLEKTPRGAVSSALRWKVALPLA